MKISRLRKYCLYTLLVPYFFTDVCVHHFHKIVLKLFKYTLYFRKLTNLSYISLSNSC